MVPWGHTVTEREKSEKPKKCIGSTKIDENARYPESNRCLFLIVFDLELKQMYKQYDRFLKKQSCGKLAMKCKHTWFYASEAYYESYKRVKLSEMLLKTLTAVTDFTILVTLLTKEE